MPRKKRNLKRETGTLRDAKLIIIASEDEFAVRQYFDFFQSTRIRFQVLPTVDGKSAPEHVLARMEEYRKKNELENDDLYWLVCDTDRWTRPNNIVDTTDVISKCKQKGIRVAFSKPCYELWLLMHFTEDLDEAWTICRQIVAALREKVGAYNKRNITNLAITDDHIKHAIRVSKLRDVQPNTIPAKLGSAVHHIIADLFALGIIQVFSAPVTDSTELEKTTEQEVD